MEEERDDEFKTNGINLEQYWLYDKPCVITPLLHGLLFSVRVEHIRELKRVFNDQKDVNISYHVKDEKIWRKISLGSVSILLIILSKNKDILENY